MHPAERVAASVAWHASGRCRPSSRSGRSVPRHRAESSLSCRSVSCIASRYKLHSRVGCRRSAERALASCVAAWGTGSPMRIIEFECPWFSATSNAVAGPRYQFLDFVAPWLSPKSYRRLCSSCCCSWPSFPFSPFASGAGSGTHAPASSWHSLWERTRSPDG